MIAALMVYGVAIAGLISLAALAIESAFAACGLPRRAVWLGAILASLIFPLGMTLNTRSLDVEPFSELTPSVTISRHIAQSNESATAMRVAALSESLPVFRWPSLPAFDAILKATWITASVAVDCFYLLGWWRVRRVVRNWRKADWDGRVVTLSEDIGPAVFGFVRPQVIVPRWVERVSHHARLLILEHEFQHVKAHDQLALLAALTLVVIAPWNPALWWQLRRLRFAIEVDCDARVLAGGFDSLSYGEVLLSVSRVRLATPMTAIALTEPRSDLERRIRILASSKPRYPVAVAAGCGALCMSLIVAAAQVDAPLLQDRPSPAQRSTAANAQVYRNDILLVIRRRPVRFDAVFGFDPPAGPRIEGIRIDMPVGPGIWRKERMRPDMPLDPGEIDGRPCSNLACMLWQ